MSTNPAHRGADRSYPALLNPPRPAGRYRLLDRNSDPRRSLPTAHSEAPVNRPCDPYCERGT
ncbi:hypothetical protein U2F26_29755 [Micromonospora sp. 4G57]|uniref:Uncharacterized protein n=1 Tax=Micromonospora sicca TaxID=2202420 RepID=A0ABU5JIE3_9ACTN|nr:MULTISPECIES: hypothetical protein [unclassified Micromonospora]MDZ5446864.1 hypothetical protein [Micromonospora sp. 4G57]MDZ5492375.1 hypothetical protein [Micromonospora sp. 4G53]